MSSNVEKLLGQVVKFEKIAEESLEKAAEKLDPKAKVRNRGTVCVPAESAKDKKDHFPINNEAQARNALARVNQFSKVPDWYSGSLQGLVSLVARKVKSKYPSIEVSKDAKKPGAKKASEYYDNILEKNAQSTWQKYNPFSKENNKGIDKLKNLNPFKTPVAPPPPGGYGLVQPPATLPAEEDTSTPPYAFPKTMNAPAEREEEAFGPPVAPAKPAAPAGRPASYNVAPEVMAAQNWLIGQGYKDMLGPAGADGKLGPATTKALKARFPDKTPMEAVTYILQGAGAPLPQLPAPAANPPAATAPRAVMPNQAYDVVPTQTTPSRPAPPKKTQKQIDLENYQKTVKHPWAADDGQTTASFADEFFKKLS